MLFPYEYNKQDSSTEDQNMFITCKSLQLKTVFLNPICLVCNEAAEK